MLIPGIINLVFVALARWLYPCPQDMETDPPSVRSEGLPRIYWIYSAGDALVAAGFAGYPSIADHFSRTKLVPGGWIAIFHAVAMAVSGSGSALWAALRPFQVQGPDRADPVLSLVAPLVFLGGFWDSRIDRFGGSR